MILIKKHYLATSFPTFPIFKEKIPQNPEKIQLKDFEICFFGGVCSGWVLKDRIAVSSTSTSRRAVRKSAALSAARNTRAADANPARIRGNSTCAAARAPSTTARICRWLKASNSNKRHDDETDGKSVAGLT